MEFFKGKFVVALVVGLAIGLIIATGIFVVVAKQDLKNLVQFSRSVASDEEQWLNRLKSLAFGDKEKRCVGGAIDEYRGCKGGATGAAGGDEEKIQEGIKECRAILGGQVLDCFGIKGEEEPSTIAE